ncbi:Immunoglobulin V-set domain [Trinorchestia longiramus]|nr:Immunoglobulin V-set domain [Trinorchestia longiramus]
MFLSHVPEPDDDLGYVETYDPDNIHDSIVKLPGRYSPKLSYGPPVTDANGILQHSRFQAPSGNTNIPPRRQNSRGNRQGYDESIFTSQIQNSEPRLAPLRSRPGHHSQSAVNAAPPTSTESDRDHWRRRSDQRTTDRQNEDHQMTDTRSVEESSIPGLPEKEETATSFDRTLPRNVTASLGGEAELPCRVLNYHGQSVLWIRRKNLQIIAAGEYRYTTDVRFSIVVDAENKEWMLKLKNVTYDDSGVYECQVATTPMLTFAVYLNVVDCTLSPQLAADAEFSPMSDESGNQRSGPEPKAVILEGREIFIPAHTPIRLTCAMLHHRTQPAAVRWYHGPQRLYPSYNRHLSISEGLSKEENYAKNRMHLHRRNRQYYDSLQSQHNAHIHTAINNALDNNHHSSGNENRTEDPYLRDILQHSTTAPYSPSASRYPFEIDALGRRNPASNLHPARSTQHSADQYSRGRDYLSDRHSTSSERYSAHDGSIVINYPKFYTSHGELYDDNHRESLIESQEYSKNNDEKYLQARYDENSYPFQDGQRIEEYGALETSFGAMDGKEEFINKTFTLTVGLASVNTAGSYTCSPLDGFNATTFIHVLSPDEHIQFEEFHITATAASTCSNLPISMLLLCSQLPGVAVLITQQRYF